MRHWSNSNLILCEAIDLLSRFFTEVIIPKEVLKELQHANAPAEVANWLKKLPQWVDVRGASSLNVMAGLGGGETEAIQLALTLPGAFLLVDDDEAREIALQKGITITGTVGILGRAARAGLLDPREAVEKLRKTTFYLSEDLANWLLQQSPRK